MQQKVAKGAKESEWRVVISVSQSRGYLRKGRDDLRCATRHELPSPIGLLITIWRSMFALGFASYSGVAGFGTSSTARKASRIGWGTLSNSDSANGVSLTCAGFVTS